MPDEWETFYLMTGSSAAALIGLLFVVATLTADVSPERAEAGSKIYITPTVYHFGAIVFIASFAVMPAGVRPLMPLVVAVPALIGLGYSGLSLLRIIRVPPQKPHWTDYLYYGVFPLAAYALLLASAALLQSDAELGDYGLGLGIVALLLVGIRDAWDLATFLAGHRQV